MFLATPLGCKLEVFQFSPALGIHRFFCQAVQVPRGGEWTGWLRRNISSCSNFGKRFHTWVFTDWKFRIFEQLINNSVTGNFPAKKLSLAGLKCNGRISARPHVSFQTGLEQKSDKWSKLSDLFLNWSAFIKVWLIRNECNSESMNKLAFFNTFV